MYNFIPMGHDCSTSTALRTLNLRKYALPFDWIQSNIISIHKCFDDNFNNFHKNLTFNKDKTRLIDTYGFEFPHDYPLVDIINNENIGEGIFSEEDGKYISDNWENYYNIVKEKYDRRIERFLNIINDTKPIIVLCRYNTNDVLYLKELFIRYFNKENIIFINASSEPFSSVNIKNCHIERNNIWNDIETWKENIDMVIEANQYIY